MTDTAALLAEYEARPARYSTDATAARLRDYLAAFGITALDVGPVIPKPEMLAALLASGRISEAEYRALAAQMMREQ